MLDSSVTSYRTALARREARERQVQARRKKRAMNTARRISAWLKQTYGVARVVLFGSVATNRRLRSRSDIDVAVWGLDAASYYEAVAQVQDEAMPFTVDLVRIEQCPHSLRAVIGKEGVEL